MLEPADVLLMDEPTNDLDIPTLEVLEESLLEFPGALVLVTHDRYLLDRVSTRLLALEGDGRATLYADFDQWQASREAVVAAQPRAPRERGRARREQCRPSAASRQLGYLEQREWNEMEARILAAEERWRLAALAVADPAVAADHQELQRRLVALAAAQSEVDRLYARWAELEAKVKP